MLVNPTRDGHERGFDGHDRCFEIGLLIAPKYVSIRYSKRLAEAGIEPSVGTR